MNDILSNFSPINLSEMDSVRLLNRQDTKFVFSVEQLPTILDKIIDSYYVLEVNGNRISNYASLYYDTIDLYTYIEHHNKRANRFKVRYRHYIDSDLLFFEVKVKSNKNRTVKKRIQQDNTTFKFNEEAKNLLNNLALSKVNELVPTLWVYYKRITLVHKYLKERVTIDINLSFKNCINGEIINYPELAILELKQERFKRSSTVVKELKHSKIYPFKLSKYCLGTLSFNPQIKHNNFKKKLFKIAKITQNEFYRTMASS